MSKPVEVTDSSFQSEVLESSTPVLVDLWAAWCAPCLMIAPVIEELAQQYAGKLKFCKLNVDSNSATTAQYGIMSIPTLLLFNQGKLVDQIVGAVPKQHLVSRLETLLDQLK